MLPPNQFPQENYNNFNPYPSQLPLNQNNLQFQPPALVPQQQNQWQQQQPPQLQLQNTHFDQSWGQQPQLQNQMSSQNSPIHQNLQGLTGFGNMPFISPQLVQDALRLSMSAPVGSSPNDEPIMIQALYDSTLNGQTYKQALESLHGVCCIHGS